MPYADAVLDARCHLYFAGRVTFQTCADMPLYQPAYPLTGLAQDLWVREAMRSGMCMSLFQASRHAPTIVSLSVPDTVT